MKKEIYRSLVFCFSIILFGISIARVITYIIK